MTVTEDARVSDVLTIQFNSIQFLFKVNTFGNVTNNISFKLIHKLN